MKPDDLKLIAEWMGYSARTRGELNDVEIIVCDEHGESGYIYNPETNPAQLLEIVKRLLDRSYIIKHLSDGYYCFHWISEERPAYESFEQAVLQAALQKAKDNE